MDSLINPRGGARARARALSLAAAVALVALMAVPAVALANDAHLTIQKTADARQVNAPDQIGFTITVSIATESGADSLCASVPNSSGLIQCPANNVVVTDTLPTTPPGLTWSIASASSPDSGAASPAGCQIASGVLTCNWGNMTQPNETKSVHITSPTSFPAGDAGGTCGTVSNTAQVAYKWADGSKPTGSAEAQVGVTCVPTVNLTVEKLICPSYSIVPANNDPTNQADYPNGKTLDTSYQTALTNPVTDTPKGCVPASGWQFDVGTGAGGHDYIGTVTHTLTTGSGGTATLVLNSAEVAMAQSATMWDQGLLVREEMQSSATFGELRCYRDIENGDNLESIYNLQSSDVTNGVANLYCIAYNVAPPGSLTITKSVSDAPVDWAGATFNFTATCTNDPNSPYHESIAYPGAPATITGIPAGSNCTVSEDALPTPPTNYAWDTPQVTGSPVTIQSDKTAQVTVDNTLLPPGTIIVKKVVANAYGGSTNPAQFSLYVQDSKESNVPGSPAAGSLTGTSYTLPAGTYSVGETTPIPSGYQLGDISCGPQSDQQSTVPAGLDSSTPANPATVDLASGETVVCTVTNDGIPPQLTVIKHVDNSAGGTASASDFQMTVNGTNVQPSASFPGSETGTTVTLNVGSYSVTETHQPDYVETTSGDCSGAIALGDQKTCTITNTYMPPPPPQQGFFYFTKTVTGNLNGWAGGTFTFTVTCNGQTTHVNLTVPANGGSLSSQVFGPFNPGVTCSVSEGALPAAGTSASWVNSPTYSPSASVTVVKDTSTTVTVTNTRTVTSTPPPTFTPTSTPTATPTASATASPSPSASVLGATGTPGSTGGVEGVTSPPSLPPTNGVPGGNGSQSNDSLLLLLGALGAASMALVGVTGLRGRLLERLDRR